MSDVLHFRNCNFLGEPKDRVRIIELFNQGLITEIERDKWLAEGLHTPFTTKGATP